jgi:hypothetical protein
MTGRRASAHHMLATYALQLAALRVGSGLLVPLKRIARFRMGCRNERIGSDGGFDTLCMLGGCLGSRASGLLTVSEAEEEPLPSRQPWWRPLTWPAAPMATCALR